MSGKSKEKPISNSGRIFGENIQRLRGPMSRAELAKKLAEQTIELKQNTISKWETNGAIPNGHTLDALAKIFGVEAGQLLTDGLRKPDKIAASTMAETLRMAADAIADGSLSIKLRSGKK